DWCCEIGVARLVLRDWCCEIGVARLVLRDWAALQAVQTRCDRHPAYVKYKLFKAVVVSRAFKGD
ncbi:MAG: hypothetical protein CMM01_04015, partial [Rhodopirellula sp.]|nr:hypothetical protein [Rhodopirellula sp.]